MKWLPCSVLVLALTPVVARADDKPATKDSPASEEFKALCQEFEAAEKKFAAEVQEKVQAAQKAIQEAKTAEEKEAAQKKMPVVKYTDNPASKYSPRFLALAQKYPADSVAYDALVLALKTTGPQVKDGPWTAVVELLRKKYVSKPEIKEVVRILSAAPQEAGIKLIRDVIAKNPDHKLQAQACKSLVGLHELTARFAEQIQSNETVRKRVEEQLSKEYVAELISQGGKAKDQIDELRKLLREKYSDVFPDLSIGQPAPEVVSHDLDGKEVKLSALKGKVVVLDIWATWCGPCRAMIPHERDMVHKLKDKPFTLVSISADGDKKTLADFLAKESMPWTHWWNGAQGGILESWDVHALPTIYVLDGEGVIRHKDLRGDDLEKAVDGLLKELATKK
jgi:thiol-disulfide isomerase/thioredoxin